MKARKLLWLLAVLAVVGYVACRKTDSRATEEPSPQVKESRFFGEHKSSNPQVQAIAGYLQRLNEKNGFAEKAVKKIGYPRWDKAMVFEKKTNQFIESEDSVIVTHIPFVRDSQNYVNASLVVRTSPNDTTLNYVCDWQYAQMPYGATNTDSSAENYAKYFMYMSKRTLGQSAFLITDTLLFSSSPRMHSYDRLKITILDNNAGGMPETHTTLICYPVIHCGSPQYCAAQGGCDYQNCVQPGTCYMFYDCVPFYYGGSGGSGGGSGGDPGGDPGGGTGGGGGGSGSGSGVPPDCQGPIVPSGNLIETNATCTPGWEPILPIEPEEPINPPCTGTDSYSGGTASLQYIFLESRVSEFAPFDPNIVTQPEQYFVVNDNNGALNIGPVETSTTIGGSMNGVTANTIMVVHTHPYGSQPSPSAGDFFELADFGSNFTIHYVIGFNGAKYAMVVNDHIKLQNFVNNINNQGAINPDGTFNTNSSVGFAFEGLWQLLISQGYSATDAHERAMAHIMKLAGVTMVKAPSGSNTFKKIGIQQKIINGIPQTDPNGLAIYENADCP